MPTLQRGAAWAEGRLLGDLRQSCLPERLLPFIHYRFMFPCYFCCCFLLVSKRLADINTHLLATTARSQGQNNESKIHADVFFSFSHLFWIYQKDLRRLGCLGIFQGIVGETSGRFRANLFIVQNLLRTLD